MGLWAWMTNQYFTKKFWTALKREGFLLTYTRGHKAQMHAHSVGGYSDNAKFVGTDVYGNKYYEDLDAYHVNQRRWVEMADYVMNIGKNGDRIPPKWQGWLAYQYDDVPTYGAEEFEKPFYEKGHIYGSSWSQLNVHAPPSAVNHPQHHLNLVERRNRYAQEWTNPTTKRQ